MGIAEILDVGYELVGEFAVAEPAIVLTGNAPPGAEMDLVNTDGRVQPILLGPLAHPFGVAPLMLVDSRDNRTVVGAQFGGEGVGVGFKRKNGVVLADNFKFVDGAFAEFGEEKFPDAGRAAKTHGMNAAIPAIEIPDDTDAARAGSPDGKMDAVDAIDSLQMSAQFFVSVVMAAFAHEV